MLLKRTLFTFSALLILNVIMSQNPFTNGKISGNFQIDAQYYQEDTLIGANEISEKVLINALSNINYSTEKFSAGIRYEMYQNPLLGIDKRYKGSGIAYRYATYNDGDWEITVGNFYDQFGNGLLFRSYEDRYLGFDNSVDGVRFRANPHRSLSLKGIWGSQRNYWDKGEGIVRGVDAEFNINEVNEKLGESKLRAIVGLSFLSKYQVDRDPTYKMPENVGGFAGRFDLSYGNYGLNGEYVRKINDPNATNNMIYRHGEALLLNARYSQKGLGILLSALRSDNMDFRSDRYVTGSDLMINYMPSLTRQHSYALSAFYPYATQYNGQTSYQAQINYKIKKSTLLGGKYGTDIALNFSRVHDLDRVQINDETAVNQSGTDGYNSKFFSFGDKILFQDANLEITKRISRKSRLTFDYVYLIYDKAVLEGSPGDDVVNAHITVADYSYRINSTNTIKFEAQHMFTKQDQGNWANAMIEYTISPSWFFSISDSYNYGNEISEKRIHYYLGSVAYVKNSLRVAMSYGKQRKGIMCVGGVCREVPASNGLMLSITGSF